MNEAALQILEATMELTLRPQKDDRKKVIAAVLRAAALYCKRDRIQLMSLAEEVEAL